MKILDELWYGNLEPCKYGADASKECKEVLRLISKNEEKLRATLTEDQKELFARFMDAVGAYRSMAECLLFQNSFALAARIMLTVLQE